MVETEMDIEVKSNKNNLQSPWWTTSKNSISTPGRNSWNLAVSATSDQSPTSVSINSEDLGLSGVQTTRHCVFCPWHAAHVSISCGKRSQSMLGSSSRLSAIVWWPGHENMLPNLSEATKVRTSSKRSTGNVAAKQKGHRRIRKVAGICLFLVQHQSVHHSGKSLHFPPCEATKVVDLL